MCLQDFGSFGTGTLVNKGGSSLACVGGVIVGGGLLRDRRLDLLEERQMWLLFPHLYFPIFLGSVWLPTLLWVRTYKEPRFPLKRPC